MEDYMRCSVCLADKFIGDFWRYVYSLVGHQPICDTCCASENPDAVGRPQRVKRKDNVYSQRRSQEERARMLHQQGWKCPICDLADVALVDDHDHRTGFRRGLLCRRCNSGLGFFLDSTKLLRAAIRYLRFHRAKFQKMMKLSEGDFGVEVKES